MSKQAQLLFRQKAWHLSEKASNSFKQLTWHKSELSKIYKKMMLKHYN
jgi:hypothetical protein